MGLITIARSNFAIQGGVISFKAKYCLILAKKYLKLTASHVGNNLVFTWL